MCGRRPVLAHDDARPERLVVKTVATTTGRLDVHGLQLGGGFVWIADNRRGLLYRLKA